MKTHNTIKVKDTPNTKHQWVLSEKRTYFVNINRCTETGDIQLISDLPLTELEIKTLVGVN